jgi:hypothetical protein
MFSKVARIISVVLFCLLALSISSPLQTALAFSPDHPDGLEIFARDVFAIVGVSLRNPDSTTAPDAPLFNDAGVNLGLTWGQWSAASAMSTVRVSGGASHPRTDVRIQLTGLIPNGVYSIFYINLSPDTNNPLCLGVERGLPLTAVKADQQLPDSSSFVADGSGAANFHSQVDANLLAPAQLIFEVIYHNNGQTYGSLPNVGEFQTQGPNCRSSYGEDAMRQLFILQKQ